MTILFEQDWLRNPQACIHYETKNKSFIRVAEVYYRMGVKNNAFHLSLLQPELKNIDPHDPDLPMDIKLRIVRECKDNFWYFLREVVRVPVPGSMEASSFSANRGNIALYWFFFNHVMTLIVILRQTGKTTTLVSLVTYLLNFGSANTFINLLTKSEGLKAETLSKVKAFFEELPDWCNFSTKKDIFNSDEVKLEAFNNKFKGNLSSSSPKQAEKVGRGFTSPINLIDEGAFVENIAIAMGAMLMSGNAARTFAEQQGNPYGTVIATTAGNTDDRDGGYIYALTNAATLMSELFYDAVDRKELNELVFKNSSARSNETKRPIIHISLTYRQLGYDDDWMEAKLAENISTPENLKRDLFNQWLSGSTLSPIDKKFIELINNNIIETPRSHFFKPFGYLLRWFIEEKDFEVRCHRGVTFVIGVDTSDAAGRDDVSFNLRDPTTGQVACAAIFNEINLITLADFFVTFMVTYENTVMVMERRSSAATILDYMVKKFIGLGINPFKRLYNTIVQEKEKYENEFELLMNTRNLTEEICAKYKKHLGFTTSGSGATSRSELYSTTLNSMLKYTGALLHDEKTIRQISALIMINNRIDHPPGGNDDAVISALLSYWLLINGKNLHIYGINTNQLLKQNTVYLGEKYDTNTKGYTEEEIISLEDQFDMLTEQLKNERDPILSKQIELKIKRLATEIEFSSTALTVEELIDNINRDKRFSYR